MLPFHPYADLFPLIEGPEFDDLVADVKANDVREKIVVWDGAILDGRNRYRAALSAGLLEDDDGPDRAKYFTRFVPAVDGDPLSYVISKNLKRRHLSDIQRASIAGKIANLGRGRPSGDIPDNPPIGGLSAEEAASTMNVAARQVERARVVHAHGVPELREALDRGDVAVSAAEKIARLPEDEQRRHLPSGARAIMASRQEPDDSLDYFPTPPWATRALVDVVLRRYGRHASLHAQSVWEPACGEGHMAEVLREYFRAVVASDIHDYGYGHQADFLDAVPGNDEWIITNPPFNDKAEAFVLRAIEQARVGVAMFLRLQWLETIGRYERIFAPHPPAVIAQFAERVPLHKGRWEPTGTTATAYLWIVWLKQHKGATEFMWIPPGQRERLTNADDVERFTARPVTRGHHDLVALDTGEIIDSDSPESQLKQKGDWAEGTKNVVHGPGNAYSPCEMAGADAREMEDIPAFLRRTANNAVPETQGEGG